MKKWTFKVGIVFRRNNRNAFVRKVSVFAETCEEAVLLAREKLDEIAMSKNEEVPVAWDLTLVRIEG